MSIAAVRLGVIIGNENLISQVKKAQLSFDTNAIALLFGEKILDHRDMIEDLIQIEKEGKEFLIDTFIKHGYSFKECNGNFILVKPRHDAHSIAEQLMEEKILVHTFGNELLKDYLRVSIGSKKFMKIFVDSFLKIDND